jgi:hypothetical protein
MPQFCGLKAQLNSTQGQRLVTDRQMPQFYGLKAQLNSTQGQRLGSGKRFHLFLKDGIPSTNTILLFAFIFSAGNSPAVYLS